MSNNKVASALTAIAVNGVRRDLNSISWAAEPDFQVDWSYLLMCASALTSENTETAQAAILRVAQGCLQDPSSSAEQRAAAVVLLHRVGNELSIALAESRGHLGDRASGEIPMTMALDAGRRKSELTVRTVGGKDMSVNPFQLDFWSMASRADWISISAPTSAGKSHIVKEWLANAFQQDAVSVAVYVAPTRALVEEVGTSLTLSLADLAEVSTLPWESMDVDENPKPRLFVLTQERLQLLHQNVPNLSIDILFIDEAHKIGDGPRGVLLSRVIDDALSRNSKLKLIFASPLTANPEVLVATAPLGRVALSQTYETVTVNQNLIHVTSVAGNRRRYEVELLRAGRPVALGELLLGERPVRVPQRLAFIASALAGDSSGNLVYVNGPGEAETVANILYELLGSGADVSSQEDIAELREMIEETVHPKYTLGRTIRRGVAFHYGAMPLALKSEIEQLFRSGSIKFLVCTSTLLEGVNLPCRNLFVRGPRKGRGNVMTPGDFWNLAGRAGRWGQEFEGNIVCIDVQDADVWPAVPRERVRGTIAFATDGAISRSKELASYISAGAPSWGDGYDADLESLYSHLANQVLKGNKIEDLFGFDAGPLEGDPLEKLVDDSVSDLLVSHQTVQRHAGISPLSLDRLGRRMSSLDHPELLALANPEDDLAYDSFDTAFAWVSEYLGGSFQPELRRKSLARLVVQWIRGMPLRLLIDNRVEYRIREGLDPDYPNLIRRVMDDIENIARYEAPKYLACYSDVVREAASIRGIELEDNTAELVMMLELGVARRTDMSFVSLGLSRSSATALATFAVDSNLTPAQALEWLRRTDLDQVQIPNYVRREIGRLVAHEPASGA